MMAAYGAYTKAMVDAGVFKAGDRLDRAANGTTIRTENGKTKVLNGPYAESQGTARRLLSSSNARISTPRCRGRRAAPTSRPA